MIKTILLIEESEKTRQALSSYLRLRGYLVVDVSNTNNFYELLYKHHVDLIITGMIQPGMDGFELLKEVKSNHFYNRIPVIISTKIEKPTIIKEALRLGAAHYIVRKKHTVFSWFVEVKTIIDMFELVKLKPL